MALRVFWENVRRGAGNITPRRIADSYRLETREIQRCLESSTRWVNPDSVAGYDPADFDFLPPNRVARLAKLVGEFLQVTSEIDPLIAPPTEEQRRDALPPFRDIVALMEFDRFADPDAYLLGNRIERSLQRYHLNEIADLRFNTDLDHAGDPGIWIWVYLSDDSSKAEEEFLDNTRRIRPILDAVARKVAPERWPYIAFRLIGELAYLAEVQRAQ